MRKSIGRRPLLAGAALAGGSLIGSGMGWTAGGPPLDGDMARWVMETSPPESPPFTVQTADGTTLGPADFEGRLILMNFWATWCKPCIAEMGSLDRLQAAYAGQPMEVVAVSIDRGGAAVVTPFFAEKGIETLAVYLDPAGNTPVAFKSRGVPTTILLSPDGRVLGRFEGPAEWDEPAARALIDHFLAQMS